MNRQEAKRYAHKLTADAVERIEVQPGPDRPAIRRALDAIAEQHTRFGPKKTDRPPRLPVYTGEPLPFTP